MTVMLEFTTNLNAFGLHRYRFVDFVTMLIAVVL